MYDTGVDDIINIGCDSVIILIGFNNDRIWMIYNTERGSSHIMMMIQPIHDDIFDIDFISVVILLKCGYMGRFLYY